LIDHDELRHDPVLAVLAGKLAARRSDCAPVAGESTLNRLELSRAQPSRYHKISYDAAAIEGLLSMSFSTRMPRRPSRSSSTSTPPMIPCTGIKRGASSTATTTITATCRSTFSLGGTS
jgi:hypothetical protein